MEPSQGIFGHKQLRTPLLHKADCRAISLSRTTPTQRASVCGQSIFQSRSAYNAKRHLRTDSPFTPPLEDRTESQRVQAAQGYGGDDIDAKRKNRQPPTLVMRVLAAVFYMVPWMDIAMVGGEIHHKFPSTIILHLIPGPFLGIYYSSQFAPLIIFFLLFLSVVKNFKLHHFTRFHCMQAIVLDIVTMLFTLVRQYFPAEVRWSYIMDLYDMFAYSVCICTILYCIFFALAGHYADIPYVSESTYMQVEEG